MSWIKLILENKGHRNPRACVRRHVYAYACSRLAYMGMRTHVRVSKTIKDKFSALKLSFGMNPTLSRSNSKPSFSQYKKPYMVPFQNIEKILRKNTRVTRNSE